MRVYRYEMLDGGGPTFTLDGVHRKSGVQVPTELPGYVSGWNDYQMLMDYGQTRGFDTTLCRIVTYDIPDDEIRIIPTTGQLFFPKFYVYKRLGKDVAIF